MTKPLNDTQIRFMLHVLYGRIVWLKAPYCANGYMGGTGVKFHPATMDYFLRRGSIALPASTDPDRRIQLTDAGRALAEGLAGSWPEFNAEAAQTCTDLTKKD